jgi:hypothetical protein
MNQFALAPGLLVDAEVAYRQERVRADLADGGRRLRWWQARRRRAAGTDALALAA